MQQLFDIIFTTSFAYSILRVSTPLILAGMAALVSERAGVANIAIEGMMLISALTGVVVSAKTQSCFLGVSVGVIAGILVSLILAYFILQLKANNIMCGLAINAIAKGGTVFVLYLLTGSKGASTALNSTTVPKIDIPLIKDIPILGEIISGQSILTYLAIIMVALMHIFIFKTRMGIRISAVGENEKAVDSVGISVAKTRYIALLISGFFSGLAGVFLSMSYMSGFTANMTSGRGFIALAANSMGQNTPWGTLAAALIFGAADSAANYLQVLAVPAQFIQMIPYVTTILGITLYCIYRGRKEKKLKMKMLSHQEAEGQSA